MVSESVACNIPSTEVLETSPSTEVPEASPSTEDPESFQDEAMKTGDLVTMLDDFNCKTKINHKVLNSKTSTL